MKGYSVSPRQGEGGTMLDRISQTNTSALSNGVTEHTRYGQAEYYYAVSREILADLVSKNLITEEQRQRIDELDRDMIFSNYPSIEDFGLGGITDA